tara:strand:+ start:3849 stop:4025 length:177 start_codon:yes stop_codon:yes gene_type:complete
MDPITKWLVRIASLVIIIAGFAFSLIVPVAAIRISSQFSIAQDTIRDTLQVLLQQFFR